MKEEALGSSLSRELSFFFHLFFPRCCFSFFFVLCELKYPRQSLGFYFLCVVRFDLIWIDHVRNSQLPSCPGCIFFLYMFATELGLVGTLGIIVDLFFFFSFCGREGVHS